MKAAPFEYVRAEGIEHALALLSEYGGDAKLIAGGQSLVPMMAMRLARPAWLVDIDRIGALKAMDIGSGTVAMGAGVRQRTIEDTAALDTAVPLVKRALHWVGHIQTRNRGTAGGSLVHADPSAELPLAALVLGATMHLKSAGGAHRSVKASDFFLGPMFTAVGETELLATIDWPVWAGPRVAAAFEETAIRHGDFAMASAACQLQLDANGTVRRASFGAGGVAGTPLVFPELAQRLVGQRVTSELADELAHSAAQASDPGSDLHASAAYRRHLAAVLMSRVLQQAARDALSVH